MQDCFFIQKAELVIPKVFFPFNSASFMTNFCQGNSLYRESIPNSV